MAWVKTSVEAMTRTMAWAVIRARAMARRMQSNTAHVAITITLC